MDITAEKIQEIIDKLDELEEKYFNAYVNMEPNTCDYFMTVGHCAGIIEASDIIKELLK